MKLANNKTFMQLYRQWQRSERTQRPHIDKCCIERYGMAMARMLDQWDQSSALASHCNIHTRINYRASAIKQLGSQWHKRSLDLNKRWRLWSETQSHYQTP